MDLTVFKIRLAKLKEKLRDNNIETAIITDEDNVYYLCGYYDYLHMDFGRPTLLIIAVSILLSLNFSLSLASRILNTVRSISIPLR